MAEAPANRDAALLLDMLLAARDVGTPGVS